jgi:MFS family permease
MTHRRRVFGIDVGWCHVAFGVIINMLVTGTTYYAYGLFIRPLTAELNLGRAAANVGLIIVRAGGAVFSPFLGHFVDRYPARWLVGGSGLAIGVSFVAIALAKSVLVMALILAGPLSFGVIAASLTVPVIAGRWIDRLRGRALATVALGTSLSGMTVVPIMAVLVATTGWRTALMCTGIGVALLLTVLSLFIREPQESGTAVAEPLPHDPPQAAARWTPSALLRNRDYQLFTFTISVLIGIDGAVLTTLIPYGQDRGFSLAQATSLLTVKTMSALCGKMVVAWIVDRIDLRILFVVVTCLSAVLCTALSLDPSYPMLIAIGSVTGIAIGGTFPLGNAILAERFGVPSLGQTNGLMTPFTALFGGAFLFLVGKSYDMTGNYHAAFEIFVVLDVFVLVALWFVTPPPATHVRRS